MGRKPKFSKEIKIKACEEYINGNTSLLSISTLIGCNKETLRQWILRYKKHGGNIFDATSTNNSYSKEFKRYVINEYTTGKYSLPDLVAKFNISYGVIRNWVINSYNSIDNKSYNPKGEIYTMKSRKTTFEERLEIVKWVIANNHNYKDAADKYGINYALVYRWVQKFKENGPQGLTIKKRGRKPKSEIDESLLSEVEKLKLELEKERQLRKHAELTVQILKKKKEFEKKLR